MNGKRKHPIRPLTVCAVAILLASTWASGCGPDKATSSPIEPGGGGGGGGGSGGEAAALPAAPDRLSATVSDGTVELRWHRVHGADGYTVYRADTPGAGPGRAEAIRVKDTRYSDRDVGQEAHHYYRVAASNRQGEGPASQEVAGRARAAVPGTPFQITVVNGDGVVTLLWPDASGAVSYALYFSTGPGVSKDTATRIAPVTSPYTHGPLANGTVYYYALAGINNGGNESPLSSEVAARPMPPPLTPPTALNATAGDGRVTLAWDPVVGAAGYAVYWSLSPGVTPETGTRIAVDAAPYEHTGLADGTVYHYVVTAVDGFGESEPTAEVSATPEAAAALPDLIVGNLQVLSYTSSSIAYRYTVTNIGDGVAWLDGPTDAEADNVSVQALISADEVFGNEGDLPAGGTILGLSPLGGLHPGESFTGQFSASAAIDLATRPYLTLKVDWGGVVEESNEDNNTRAVSIQAPDPEPPAEPGGSWEALPFMPTGRYSAAGATVDGRIYVIGGTSDGYNSLDVVERYDPATDTWQTLAPKPTANRGGLGAAVVGGKIYAMGGGWGSYSNAMERYDPATDAWQSWTPLPTARSVFVTAVVNGRIYAIGGYNGSALGIVEVYDPATNAWTTGTPMPTRRYGAAASVIGGRIYVIGGVDGSLGYLGTVEVYDPATDTWSTGAPMPVGRYGVTSQVANGNVYAIGGWPSSGGGASYFDAVDVYDPLTDSWTAGAPMPTPRAFTVSGAVSGTIYVIGGRDQTRYDLDTVEAFTP